MAIGAMLGLAMAPSLSHALSPVDASAPWLTVCSSSGVAATSSDVPGGQLPQLQHCPLCCPHSSGAALPPSEPWKLMVPDGAAFAPTSFRDVTQPLFAWTAAPARAPPVRA